MIQEIEQFRKDLTGDFSDPDSPSLDTDVKVSFRFPSGSVMKYDFHFNADTTVRNNRLFVMNIINNIVCLYFWKQYEYVFSMSDVEHFQIVNVMPRQVIPCNSATLASAQLGE